MNATTPPPPTNVTPFDFEILNLDQKSSRTDSRKLNAEEDLTSRILRNGGGKKLIEICQELSGKLVRRFMVEDDVNLLTEHLCQGLIAKLICTHQEAHCLVSLALELIHVKVHGDYRRPNVDLSYLIEMAKKAVNKVGTQ